MCSQPWLEPIALHGSSSYSRCIGQHSRRLGFQIILCTKSVAVVFWGMNGNDRWLIVGTYCHYCLSPTARQIVCCCNHCLLRPVEKLKIVDPVAFFSIRLWIFSIDAIRAMLIACSAPNNSLQCARPLQRAQGPNGFAELKSC